MKPQQTLIVYSVLGFLSGFFFIFPIGIYELNIAVSLLTSVLFVGLATASAIIAIALLNWKTNRY